MTEESMRPGIYVDYRLRTARRSGSGQCVGVTGRAATQTEKGRVYAISSPEEAETLFGAESELAALIVAVFDNGDCPVLAAALSGTVPAETAADEEGRRAALALLLHREEPACVVCGDGFLDALARETDTARARGKLLFAAAPPGREAERAEALNCERIVLCAPALRAEGKTPDVSPAVLAAMASRSPGDSLYGAEVLGEYLLPSPLQEGDINRLLRAGVTVLEPGPVCPEVVRGVTTRTKNETGALDGSLRNLATVTALDQVSGTLREALKDRFEASSGRMTLGSVCSLVECELLALEDEGLISGYEKPVVTADEDDPSICRIVLAVQIAQGVSQVFLTADIGV